MSGWVERIAGSEFGFHPGAAWCLLLLPIALIAWLPVLRRRATITHSRTSILSTNSTNYNVCTF